CRIRCRMVRATSAAAQRTAETPHHRNGPFIHPDADCVLRRQWAQPAALERPIALDLLERTDRGRRSDLAVGDTAPSPNTRLRPSFGATRSKGLANRMCPTRT